jgi:hypothetical protein
MYIELKSGYSDNGPSWIGKVKFSKSGKTIYFNNKGFKRWNGISGNYYDIETEEEYWISGVKKNGEDRHWAGKGKIIIDEKIINDYLQITGQENIDMKKFEVVFIPDEFPIDRITEIKNKKET